MKMIRQKYPGQWFWKHPGFPDKIRISQYDFVSVERNNRDKIETIFQIIST